MLFETKTLATTMPGFDACVKTQFSKKIKLPKLESYPIEYFSQTRTNFLEGITKYPCLENVFLKLHLLQSRLDNTNLVNWISICLTRKINQKTSYIQLCFSCTNEKRERAIEFVDSLGIF